MGGGEGVALLGGPSEVDEACEVAVYLGSRHFEGALRKIKKKAAAAEEVLAQGSVLLGLSRRDIDRLGLALCSSVVGFSAAWLGSVRLGADWLSLARC